MAQKTVIEFITTLITEYPGFLGNIFENGGKVEAKIVSEDVQELIVQHHDGPLVKNIIDALNDLSDQYPELLLPLPRNCWLTAELSSASNGLLFSLAFTKAEAFKFQASSEDGGRIWMRENSYFDNAA